MTQIRLDRRFTKRLSGAIERYSFEVGILKDGPHKAPRRGVRGKGGKNVLTTFAGGPARKKSGRDSGLSIAQVSQEARERIGVNYLTEPFKNKANEDILRFTDRFFKVIRGSSQPKRLENLLQAIVRNPILRGDYGGNSSITRRIKGFDRLLIDTAQVFRSIIARVKKRAVSRV